MKACLHIGPADTRSDDDPERPMVYRPIANERCCDDEKAALPEKAPSHTRDTRQTMNVSDVVMNG